MAEKARSAASSEFELGLARLRGGRDGDEGEDEQGEAKHEAGLEQA